MRYGPVRPTNIPCTTFKNRRGERSGPEGAELMLGVSYAHCGHAEYVSQYRARATRF